MRSPTAPFYPLSCYYVTVAASLCNSVVNTVLVFFLCCLFITSLFFHWRIIALQCCVSFCTTMWISCKYTYIPSPWASLPPSLPSHPSRSSQTMELRFTWIRFTRSISVSPVGYRSREGRAVSIFFTAGIYSSPSLWLYAMSAHSYQSINTLRMNEWMTQLKQSTYIEWVASSLLLKKKQQQLENLTLWQDLLVLPSSTLRKRKQR